MAVAGPIADAYGEPGLTWPLRGVALALFGQSSVLFFQRAFIALGRVGIGLRIILSESALEFTASITLVLLGAGAAGAAFGRATGYLLGALIAVALTASLFAATPADAATPSGAAVRYLERAQNTDGGFGGAKGLASNQLFSGWSALGLASAGRSPRDVSRRGGRAITTYLRRAGSLSDTGELERTILVLRSAGLSPRRFGGRDLVAELKRRRSPNGSWQGNVALTAFGVFALKAAGERAGSLKRSARWLAGAQNADGGFGFVPSAQSDTDDTGAVLQALAAGGILVLMAVLLAMNAVAIALRNRYEQKW